MKIKTFSTFNENTKVETFEEKSHFLVRNLPDLKKYVKDNTLDDSHLSILLRYSVLYALKSNNMDSLKFLVEIGADITTRNFILFKWASEHGNIELLKYLLNNSDLDRQNLETLIFWCNSSDKFDNPYDNTTIGRKKIREDMISFINKKMSEL